MKISREDFPKEVLKHLPNIRDFIGQKEILNNTEHPLNKYLDKVFDSIKDFNNIKEKYKNSDTSKDGTLPIFFNKDIKHIAILNHLEECLIELKDIFRTKTRDNLRNPPQFSKTLSELELAASFIRHGFKDIELNPDIGEGDLDLKVKVDSRELYFEIITPDIYPKLSSTNVAEIPDRGLEKIIEKLQQCTGIFGKFPIIIGVNIHESEITADEIGDIMNGEVDEVILGNHNSPNHVRKVKEQSVLVKNDENAKYISGALSLDRKLSIKNLNFNYDLTGNIFSHASSSLPLKLEEIDKIKQVLSDN